jgi:capsular polysaccharide transport system permease protein
MAEKFYEMALQSLQRAQFEATRQATYLEVFVHPALAERSLYPRRVTSVLIAALVSFGAWIFLLMIYYSVREHI